MKLNIALKPTKKNYFGKNVHVSFKRIVYKDNIEFIFGFDGRKSVVRRGRVPGFC